MVSYPDAVDINRTERQVRENFPVSIFMGRPMKIGGKCPRCSQNPPVTSGLTSSHARLLAHFMAHKCTCNCVAFLVDVYIRGHVVRAFHTPFPKMTSGTCAMLEISNFVKFNPQAVPKATFSKKWSSRALCAGYFTPRWVPFWVEIGEITLPKAT